MCSRYFNRSTLSPPPPPLDYHFRSNVKIVCYLWTFLAKSTPMYSIKVICACRNYGNSTSKNKYIVRCAYRRSFLVIIFLNHVVSIIQPLWFYCIEMKSILHQIGRGASIWVFWRIVFEWETYIKITVQQSTSIEPLKSIRSKVYDFYYHPQMFRNTQTYFLYIFS